MQQAEKSRLNDSDPIGERKEEKALQHFKDVLEDLLVMLRISCDSDTACMYWVNRKREQFVLESHSTLLRGVMYQDRVNFSDFPFEAWKDITEPVFIEVGKDLQMQDLSHHVNEHKIGHVLLLPFINNDETVSLTIVELSAEAIAHPELLQSCTSYLQSVGNILKTYLELSEMLEDERKWESYDHILDSFTAQKSAIVILDKIVTESVNLISNGGACLLARGMDGWHVVMSGATSSRIVPAGLKMSEASQCGLVLKSGVAEFSLHFNGNPKLISPKEPQTEGASLSVPLYSDRKCQAILVVWDNNPLIFRESLKHMVINMCRTAGLLLNENRDVNTGVDDLLLTTAGAYQLEVVERIVERELQRRKEGFKPVDTKLVLMTPAEYQIIRTRLKTESLRELQHALATDMNPNHSGFSGLVALYTESIYAVLIQSPEEGATDSWIEGFKSRVAGKANAGTVYEPGLKFHFGITALTETHKDAFMLIQDAKRALNFAVRKNAEIVQ